MWGSWSTYIRLTALVNENKATCNFAYDASDRLSEEVRVELDDLFLMTP